jgi:hypothetical protein
MKITISNKTDFANFLDAFSKVSESFVMNIGPESINILGASPDNTLFLYGTFECSSTYNGRINIPDGKRLVSMLNGIDTNDIDLIVGNNNVSYKGKKIKFKYHTLEDDWINPPSLSIDKIKSFEYDGEWSLTKAQIQSIIKSSSYTPDTNKAYISVSDGVLICELTDKSKHNVDNYQIDLCESEIASIPVILDLDNIRLMSINAPNIMMKINSQFSIVSFDIKNKKSSLSYFITTLIS